MEVDSIPACPIQQEAVDLLEDLRDGLPTAFSNPPEKAFQMMRHSDITIEADERARTNAPVEGIRNSSF